MVSTEDGISSPEGARSRNVLVTGGCGFIGSALVRRLVSRGDRVRILDDLSVGRPDDVALPVEAIDDPGSDWSQDKVCLVEGDIRDEDAVARAVRGAEAIVHLAANTGVPVSIEHPRRDCTSNVMGTFNMLEGARAANVRRFVFASSGAPVGEIEPPIHEEVVPHPISPYGASKLAGEAYCHAYWRSFGVETVALRFGNVFGPGSTRKASVVAAFCQRVMSGKPLTIYGDGLQTRDFIYINDLVDAVERALEVDGIGGEIFQIATSRETTVREIADEVRAVSERRGLGRPEVVAEPMRNGDVPRNFSDTTKARKILGWSASHDLKAGIEETLDSFLAAGNASQFERMAKSA